MYIARICVASVAASRRAISIMHYGRGLRQPVCAKRLLKSISQLLHLDDSCIIPITDTSVSIYYTTYRGLS